ncbi:MAG: glycosyltransferase [Chthoniobacterales bacterium]|nr:glycosyltransferase [Chthoniobacterales bacterium]
MHHPSSQKTKDSLSAMAAYRQEAIHSTLCTADDRAFCWYLAAEEATNFHHQKTFFKLPKTLSVDDIAALARTHQAVETLSGSSQNNQRKVKSSLLWMFSDNTRICEPLDCYRYWIARSLEITSPHLAEEKKTIIKTLDNLPEGKAVLQKILKHFEVVRELEKTSKKKDPLDEAILLHRAKTVLFTAFYLAILKTQKSKAQQEGEKKSLLFFSKIEHCLEQKFLLRKRIAEATQQEEEGNVRYLTLMVSSWNSVENCYQQAADCVLKSPKESSSWYQIALYGEQVTANSQRLVETIITTPNKIAAGLLEHVLFLLRNAFDYRIQMMGVSPFFNHEFALWLKKASIMTKRSAFLWTLAARTTIAFSSCSTLSRLWKAAALYIEYQARNKIQRIVVRNNIQQAQQALKDPIEEKKYYRTKIIHALLADQEQLAQHWRLAAEEAYFFSTISNSNSPESLSEEAWQQFLQQFSSKKTFLLFLYQTSKKEKPWTLSLKNPDLEEARAHYRYWIIRATAEKNKNLFAEENWLEKLPFLYHSQKTACAAARLENVKIQAKQNAPHQVSLQAAVRCAEKALSFRTKAAEATLQHQEFQARQWTLAAYTMDQAVDGYAKFSDAAWWISLAELAQEATTYRLKVLEMDQANHPRRAAYFEKAAFLLENNFDQELELRTSSSTNPESLTAWEKVFEQAKAAAVLWATAGSTALWWKQFVLKRKAQKKEKEIRKKIMGIAMKKISFCLPPEAFPSAASQEVWNQGKLVPRLEFSVPHAWIYQTWKLLQNAGINYPLSTQLLEPGIVIGWGFYVTHRIGTEQPFPADLFFLDIIGDQLPNPNAHLYLAQNKAYAKYTPHSLFMPHWTQRSLIPRHTHRGDRFENVAFFGDPSNCAEELKSEAWKERLFNELGIHFIMQGNMGWHDYSAVDAVVAIRSFSKQRYFYKPATKLCNAWLAGVPFIGGPESAYAQAGTPGQDHLVATSTEELLQHLKRLKEDLPFRRQLVECGRVQVAAFTPEATLERWKELLQKTIPAYAAQWQEKSPLERRWFFFVNRLIYFLNFYLQA